jgi:hypothetical protein
VVVDLNVAEPTKPVGRMAGQWSILVQPGGWMAGYRICIDVARYRRRTGSLPCTAARATVEGIYADAIAELIKLGFL